MTGQAPSRPQVNKLGQKNGSRSYWYATCDCGNKVIVAGTKLTANEPRYATKSCGCYKRDQTIAACKKEPFTVAYNHLLLMAKRRGIKVLLSFRQYVGFTKQALCHYCDMPIQWAAYRKAGQPFGHNLDRKDASKPYSKGNCVPCCPGCNESKMNRSYEEWVFVGRAIKFFRENKTKSVVDVTSTLWYNEFKSVR